MKLSPRAACGALAVALTGGALCALVLGEPAEASRSGATFQELAHAANSSPVSPRDVVQSPGNTDETLGLDPQWISRSVEERARALLLRADRVELRAAFEEAIRERGAFEELLGARSAADLRRRLLQALVSDHADLDACAEALRLAAEGDPPLHREFVLAAARRAEAGTGLLCAILGDLSPLAQADADAVLESVASRQFALVGARGDADASLETAQRRELALGAGSELMRRWTPAELEARLTSPTATPEERLLFLGLAQSQARDHTLLASPSAPALLAERLVTDALTHSARPDERADLARVDALALLPPALAHPALLDLISAEAFPLHAVDTALTRVVENVSAGLSAEVLRRLEALPPTAPQRLHLARIYASVSEVHPTPATEVARYVTALVQTAGSTAATGERLGAIDLLSGLASTRPSAAAALENLAHGGAGDLSEVLLRRRAHPSHPAR